MADGAESVSSTIESEGLAEKGTTKVNEQTLS
jgi:hypothetical protein